MGAVKDTFLKLAEFDTPKKPQDPKPVAPGIAQKPLPRQDYGSRSYWGSILSRSTKDLQSQSSTYGAYACRPSYPGSYGPSSTT